MSCMTYFASILMATVFAAVPPLTQTQRIILEDVAPPSQTVDEAGLYALLSNAKDWDDEVRKNLAGAIVPDYVAIRSEPSQYRGQVFALEGTLESYIGMGQLSRVGWESAKVMVIRTEADGVIMVYLTDPPLLQIASTLGQHELPAARGAPVRLAGRFFKFVIQANQEGQAMVYPVFVGKSVEVGDKPANTPSSTGGSWGTVALVVLAVVLLIAYGLIRRMGRQPSQLAQRLAQRQAEAERDGRSPVEIRDDLPQDPASAMAKLENEHEDVKIDGDRSG